MPAAAVQPSQAPEVRIGTSGWHYRSWVGPFYPPRMPARDLLGFYAGHFDTTEINASFYRLPTEATVAGWRRRAPRGFLFAWKCSRFITHFKKLRDVEASIELVFGRMAALGETFGPVLFQLPPQLKPDLPRLADFLDLLPPGHLYAVEFRDPGWYAADVLTLLADRGVSLCLSDHHAAPAPTVATAGHVYIRPHGPGGRYAGSYPDAALDQWAGRIAAWRDGGHRIFCYFDNDQKSAAPEDAARLKSRLGLPPAPDDAARAGSEAPDHRG